MDQRKYQADQRHEDMKRVHGMMKDVNDISEGMNVEIHTQGDQIVQLKDHMEVGDANVKAAHGELNQILENERRQNKKTGVCCLVVCGLVAMIFYVMFCNPFSSSNVASHRNTHSARHHQAATLQSLVEEEFEVENEPTNLQLVNLSFIDSN